jgi:predicted RNA-binding Zn-ribbon protein involved in translation (DUF1610 family)
MTTVRAQCPECGDVRLQIHDLTVVVGDDADMPSSYRFTCPSCDHLVTREATARIVDLLVGAGAAQEIFRWPAELTEPHLGPPITADDLLDLHVLLATDTWFDEVVALVRHSTPE